MAHQSPMIAMPKKSTDEVDWTSPIRSLISQSYGESPDNYATECAALQRCRQDAVRGAGSDITARDLLYKYFGQLELLELRFSEIRVNFPWRDAFTNKLITQTSIAYEKASVLFQIAATHSSIAASQSRSDPEGLKRAFYYFKTCAGMLNYINENFLHAPSTDLSREVVKYLISIILAQATEVFFEKCAEEKKGPALVSKIAAQAASMYTSLNEEVKEFVGKGIFDRNWVALITIKSKYFTSLSHYYRGLADSASGKHGDALVRFNVAENLAKEAARAAASYASMFVSTMSPTLPADAGTSIQDRTKAHHALLTEKKAEAQRENDLIYNAILPAADALPAIDKAVVANPIPIQEVYGTPEVQKTIGPDMFIRLVPLSVHESASVYSEEKAKLVRGEVENAEDAEVQCRSALESLGIKDGIGRFRAMAEGEVGGDTEIPVDVQRWKADIGVIEQQEGVEAILAQVNKRKTGVQNELAQISRDLETESRECEAMRVKYDHQWMQEPSAGPSRSLRQDLKSHYGSLEAADSSDRQVAALWDSIKGDVRVLLSPELERIFHASIENAPQESLLDLDTDNDADEAKERAKIGRYVSEIEERQGRLNKIARERNEVLKDLKEKIQTDDVSHILLLNRRNTGAEPALFAAELEKFRPFQQRLETLMQHQDTIIQEITTVWKKLKAKAGRGPGARRWEDREKRKNDTVRRFSRTRDAYMEVKDGLAKGMQFYGDLTELVKALNHNVKQFVSSRTAERDSLASKLEIERRLSSSSAPPPKPAPPPRPSNELASAMSGMNIQNRSSPAPSNPPHSWTNTPPPPAAPSWQSYSQSPSAPPVPPTPYGVSTAPPHAYNPHHQSPAFPPHAFPPPPPQRQPSFPPPPPTQQSYAPPAPAQDPYASLSSLMFNSPQQPPTVSPPPPPQQYNAQPQGQYGGQQYGAPQPPLGYGSPPPPPPGAYGTPPPPPQGQNYGYHNYGR